MDIERTAERADMAVGVDFFKFTEITCNTHKTNPFIEVLFVNFRMREICDYHIEVMDLLEYPILNILTSPDARKFHKNMRNGRSLTWKRRESRKKSS